MRSLSVILVALALFATSLAVAMSARATTASDPAPTLVLGPTDRFGGGAVVAVQTGETTFGVRYGTQDHPNDLMIFAEYRRYLGGADLYDHDGNYLRSQGIPVYTLLAQRLDVLVEFNDTNQDGLLNFHAVDRFGNVSGNDTPVKALALTTAWDLTGPTTEVVGDTTYVNFTLGAPNLPYSVVWDPLPRRGTDQDGRLDLLAFTFHLQAHVRDFSATVPWYSVTLGDGLERSIERANFLEWRNVSGQAVEVGAKYDHDIEGWDFAAPTDLLALETHLIFGNLIPGPVAEFLHLVYYRDHAESPDGRYHQDANTTEPDHPMLYTQDRIYFADDWERVGRFQWTSNVTVDGAAATMTFQVQGGGPISFYGAHGLFVGFGVRGAFIYPNGQTIFHDPAMFTEAIPLSFPTGFNATPVTILAAQLAVVALAMGPALYLRAKARRAK